MAVVIETTVGDLTVDLFLDERPRACQNFLKLCALKYYNYNLFHTIQQGFIAQTGDPTGAGLGGSSVWGVLQADSDDRRYFKAEQLPRIRHSDAGLLSMVSLGDGLIGSQFFFTLGADLTSLDNGTGHCVIGRVTEGIEVLRTLNETICDGSHRPYQDVRITHTVILEDPFENPRGFRAPSRSPSPSAERLQNGRIAADEDVDDRLGKSEQEIAEMLQEREARAQATILEIVGDLPDADMAPPENVLFVCKLNPVTSDDDLEIIFGRFGRVVACEVIRDRTTNDSLQYAFVEFEDAKTCETAYFKMDNVLIDDRRIHVDFSQSVAKVQWKGKGRGLIYKDGQKGDRLNFGDLKGAPKAEGGRENARNGQRPNQRPTDNNDNRSRGERNGQNHRTEANDRDSRSDNRRERDRLDVRRDADRSDGRRERDNSDRRRDADRSEHRNSDNRRDSDRQRRRSPSPAQRQRRPIDHHERERSERRNDRNHRPERSASNRERDNRHDRSQSPRRQRSRSPVRNSDRRTSKHAPDEKRRSSPVRPSKPDRKRQSSDDSESDSSSSEDERRHKRASKKSKSKKSKKSKAKKKSSKKSKRKHASSSDSEDSDSDSTEDSSDDDRRRTDKKRRK